MKKTLLFLATILIFTFTSCKKERTCTCSTTNSKTGTSYSESSYYNGSYYVYSQVSEVITDDPSSSTQVTVYEKIPRKDKYTVCPKSETYSSPFDYTYNTGSYSTSTGEPIKSGEKGTSISTSTCVLK